jgi:hypothetical protein
MQKNFKPITADSPEALKEVTAFRSFVQLPEERASQQLYQIDPDAYRTCGCAWPTVPADGGTSPLALPLRRRLSNCARPSRTRLSTSFALDLPLAQKNGVGTSKPSVARRLLGAISLALDQPCKKPRRLGQRASNASWLGTEQPSSSLDLAKLAGDALKADLAFRDALQQNRLGAASGFIAGGPSIGNLSQAGRVSNRPHSKTTSKPTKPLPGGFNQQPSTAANVLPDYKSRDSCCAYKCV